MGSSTPRWTRNALSVALPVLMLVALSACTRDAAPGSRVLGAQVEAGATPALELQTKLAFSKTLLAALDRGVPLTLALDVRARDALAQAHTRFRYELRYLPLSQQYLLRDGASGRTRHFLRRAQLLAALDRLRVNLPASYASLAPGAHWRITLALDRDELPGPLRLPARLRADLQLSTPEYAWTSG
jgi:hypothetical protein